MMTVTRLQPRRPHLLGLATAPTAPTALTAPTAPRAGDRVPEGADWSTRAACKDVDPDELFVTGAAQNKVKTRCFGCVVRTECLSDALDNRVEFGVWGGMTERERRALLRRRPDVVNWKALLFSARTEALGHAVG